MHEIKDKETKVLYYKCGDLFSHNDIIISVCDCVKNKLMRADIESLN